VAKEQAQSVNRRKFIDILLGGSGLAVLGGLFYPLIRFFTPPEQEEAIVSSVNLGPVNDYKPNSSKIFRFGSKPGIIIRDKDSQFRAFYATCTHLDCTVQYELESESIWCACHNGRYDLNGTNISGPPPRPLSPLKVNILPQSNELVITVPEGEQHGT
jgi:cytochrome b6-f complex iron-sulfur subunit